VSSSEPQLARAVEAAIGSATSGVARRRLTLTGLDRMIPLYNTRTEALDAINDS
jgi:hypothetical protein